ncbi:hypothetical protein DJY80_15025 [Yersinia pestis subsp. pestis bv. Medievalis]|nr:hypothetical protein DJY80_15025 [Yersinia pestis subsp. pestis bv. Medievalis]
MSLHVAMTDKSEAIYGGGFTFPETSPEKQRCSGSMKAIYYLRNILVYQNSKTFYDEGAIA